MTMTAIPLHDSPTLIPCAFEPNVRPYRATPSVSSAPAVAVQTARPDTATVSTSYVVAAPHRPTTVLEGFAAVLGDVVLGAALVLGLVLVPVLALNCRHLVVVVATPARD